MGMFSRVNDIIQANINSLLDKAENPQKLLNLIVAEMEESIVEIRTIAAKNIAAKKSLDRKQAKNDKKIKEWNQKAELAMSKGREDLAKAALVQKHELQAENDAVQKEIDAVQEQLSAIQQDADRLAEKLAEAKAKQKSFVVRHESAKARLSARSVYESNNVEEVLTRFDSYEQKIDELEAQVDSYEMVTNAPSLEAEFKAMENEEKLNEELEQLRKKVA